MDSELSDTDGEVETDDDVEGTLLLHVSLAVTEVRMQLRTRLAVSRNANDRSEVDDSSLNARVLTYTIPQAADVQYLRTGKSRPSPVVGDKPYSTVEQHTCLLGRTNNDSSV